MTQPRRDSLIAIISAIGLIIIVSYLVFTHPAESLCITERWCPSFAEDPIIVILFMLADFVLIILAMRLGLWIVVKLFERGIAYLVVGLMLAVAAVGLIILSFVQATTTGERVGFWLLSLLPGTLGLLMVVASVRGGGRQKK